MGVSQAAKAHPRYEKDSSRTVVETVAEAEGVEPAELDTCLYDIIDPDALNQLFQYGEDGPTTDGLVSFTYHGYEVTVHADSSVEIDLIED